MQTRRRSAWLAGFGLLLVLSAGVGCKITVGGGGSYGNLYLAVPYFSQGNFLLCVPTSVLMWRRYDGLGYISPANIGSQMGCPPSVGCALDEIADGVAAFTVTGNDAYLDDYGGVVGDPIDLAARFFSRQITSLNNGVPVIAIVNGGLHAVVPFGGHFSTAYGGLKRWDYIRVRDPWDGDDIQYTAGVWMDLNAHQVVSSSAINGWEGNAQTYGNSMRVRGAYQFPRVFFPQP